MLLHGEKIGKDLRGVELVGEAIPDRNACICCKLLHDLLTKSTVLDAVKHAAKHTGSVRNALLFSNLRAIGVEIDGMHAKINQMTEECQMKLQDTMQKVVNDSNGGLVCIII